MSQEHPHVAEKPDILSCDAQWWKEFAEVMKPMVFHLQDLQAVFRDGKGDAEHFEAIYDGTRRLEQDMVELKEQQQKVLDMFLKTKDDWTTAVSTRSGELGRLDIEVHRRTRELETRNAAFQEADKQRRAAREEFGAVEKLIEQARKDLEEAKTNKATLQETFRQEVNQSLARQKEDIRKRIDDWKADIGKASAQQQGREDDLVARERHLEKLSRNLVEEKEKSAGVQSQNESQAQNLRKAYSTLQGLANWTGISSTLPPTLSQVQDLAVSIENRFTGLRSNLTETERSLTSEQEQSTKVMMQLEAKNKEIERLKTSLLTNERLAFDLRGKSDELQRLQPVFEDQGAELRIKTRENTGLLEALGKKTREVEKLRKAGESVSAELETNRIVTVPQLTSRLQHAQTKLDELESSSQHDKKLYQDLQIEHTVIRTQCESLDDDLKTCQKDLQSAQDNLSGLRTYTIPNLETSKKLATDELAGSTKLVKSSKEHAERADAAAKKVDLMNVSLNASLKKALADLKLAQDLNTRSTHEAGQLRDQISAANIKHQETMHTLGAKSQKVANYEEECRKSAH